MWTCVALTFVSVNVLYSVFVSFRFPLSRLLSPVFFICATVAAAQSSECRACVVVVLSTNFIWLSDRVLRLIARDLYG